MKLDELMPVRRTEDVAAVSNRHLGRMVTAEERAAEPAKVERYGLIAHPVASAPAVARGRADGSYNPVHDAIWRALPWLLYPGFAKRRKLTERGKNEVPWVQAHAEMLLDLADDRQQEERMPA